MLSFSKTIDFILIQARIKEIAALACTPVVQMKDRQDCRHLLDDKLLFLQSGSSELS